MVNINTLINYIQNKLKIKVYAMDYSYYSLYINKWFNWYSNEDPSFHVYKQFNGIDTVTEHKARLKMAKRVCEDHSSLTCNENIVLNIKSKQEADFLLGYDEVNGLLGKNNFWKNLGEMYELTCALGTGAYEVIVTDLIKNKIGQLFPTNNSKIKLVKHSIMDFIPISWDSDNNIIEVVFIDNYKIKDQEFIDLRLHILEDGKYVIINKKLHVFGSSISEVKNDETIIDKLYTNSETPWFSILKLPIVNNFDIKCPLGVSVYGNAIDILKCIDDAFNALSNEYKHSDKKVFYSKALLNRDPDTGNVINPDSINKHVFYYLGDNNTPQMSEDIGIKEYNPKIRVEELTKGLESLLSYLSSLCGLGNNYYKFSDMYVKTATEVASANHNLMRSIRKNEIALEQFIVNLLHSILHISNYVFNTTYDENCAISVDFDATIINDEESERTRDLSEVDAGVMSIDEFREKWYNVGRRGSFQINE
jgi:A118 family predicted phage portal protein